MRARVRGVTCIVAENLIFYGCCFFMSLIGLGMTWQTREKYLFAKSIFLVFIVSAITILYLWFPTIFQFLDIRHSLRWLNDHEPSRILLGRMKFFIIFFTWSVTIFSMVFSQHIFLFWRQHVTRSKSTPAAGRS